MRLLGAVAIAALLTAQAIAQSNTGLCDLAAMEVAPPPVIERLLRETAGPFVRCYDGYTPLHVAVQAGNIGAIRLIVSAGADLDAKNEFGSTPLHVAVMGSQELAAATLLDLGADPQSVGSDDQTAMDMAVTWNEPEIYKILVRYGARY